MPSTGTTFNDLLNQYDFDKISRSILIKTEKDVARALQKRHINLEDFKALISPAAETHIKRLATLSHQRTIPRFGKTISMFIPLYLSSYCNSSCTYCGFSKHIKQERKILNDKEILAEAMAIKRMGFEHVLLLTGESPRLAGVSYLENALQLLRPHFANLSIEVQPLSEEEYRRLIDVGLYGVFCYQETYCRERYNQYHKSGEKADFDRRLHTADRLGMAGVHKIGIGALLGLEDWRAEAFFTALHLDYLRQKYWKSIYSISLPRLKEHAGDFRPQNPISERQFVQLIAAYRLFDENVELSLSTREKASFRDNLIPIGITSMSAAASTRPGGYSQKHNRLEQFAISDVRQSEEVAAQIRHIGYEPKWKDWDMSLN